MTFSARWEFDAIGTRWAVETEAPVSGRVRTRVGALVAQFDEQWSRFRSDSLVARLSAGGSAPLPADGASMLDLYATTKDERLLRATERATDYLVDQMEAFGDKTIIFGLIDIGKPEVETASGIEFQIRRILEYVDPDRLALGPDCGMFFLDRDTAKAKLTNLALATHRVRRDV